MIFGPIRKFALVNAKVRARLSTLLSTDVIGRLVVAADLAEFYAALQGTVYEPIFSRPEINFDPRVGEKYLVEKEIEWHAELLQDLRGPEKELVAHFLEKYEIENLKTALRIRDGSRGEEEIDYMVRGSLPNAIPYTAVVEAASLEDTLALLAGTPYLVPVRSAIDDYKDRGTLFPVEIALEIDYFKRLQERIEALSKKNREIARSLVGLEIDQKNISWLIRLKFYYDIPTGELMDYNIPGGIRMTREKMRKAFMAESVKEVLASSLDKSYKGAMELVGGGEELGKLYLLEIILWNSFLRQARRTLSGFPFTIGTVLAYLILKRTEIRNIITILNGKVYRMGREEIDSHLRVIF